MPGGSRSSRGICLSKLEGVSSFFSSFFFESHETFDVGRLPRYRVCAALNVKRLPTDGWSTYTSAQKSWDTFTFFTFSTSIVDYT